VVVAVELRENVEHRARMTRGNRKNVLRHPHLACSLFHHIKNHTDLLLERIIATSININGIRVGRSDDVQLAVETRIDPEV